MRNKRLDVLRCIAVLLVIARHARTRTFLSNGGWIGVDLFFVLSGFLISGLLFVEYHKRARIDFKRFFIRRGLKLYPSLYLMLFVTFIVLHFLHDYRPAREYIVELLYLRNYLPGIWDHTWTLGVEEHFYILLPILLFAMMHWSRNPTNPFRSIPVVFVVVAAASLGLRLWMALSVPRDQLQGIVTSIISPTQNRMDSLFFGVLLGYLYHFRPGTLAFLKRPWIATVLLVAAVAMVSWPFFAAPDGLFAVTLGFTLLYAGFGVILMLSLGTHDVLPRGLARLVGGIATAFAFVGTYSYSIYLWHGAVNAWFLGFLHRYLHLQLNPGEQDVLYVTGSLAFGIIMSRLVEYPVLHFRDRIFPAGPPPVAVSATSTAP